jgi:hypothetical protein
MLAGEPLLVFDPTIQTNLEINNKSTVKPNEERGAL